MEELGYTRTGEGRTLGIVNGRTISFTIVAFLIGVLAAAGIGVRVIDEVRTDEDATSLPPENVSSTTLPPAVFFVDPDETLIASTALVPISVRGTDSTFAIEYELVSLAPALGVPPTVSSSFIFPRTWTLTTESQTIAGGPASPTVRVARFDLPEGVVADDITSVQIIDPLMLYPLDTLFELSEQVPSAEIIDGVFAELLSVSEQGDSIIVQIGVDAVDPIDIMFTIEGSGPGWFPTTLFGGDRRRVDLIWVGGDLPEVMTFRARGNQWVELEGSYPVSIGRFE